MLPGSLPEVTVNDAPAPERNYSIVPVICCYELNTAIFKQKALSWHMTTCWLTAYHQMLTWSSRWVGWNELSRSWVSSWHTTGLSSSSRCSKCSTGTMSQYLHQTGIASSLTRYLQQAANIWTVVAFCQAYSFTAVNILGLRTVLLPIITLLVKYTFPSITEIYRKLTLFCVVYFIIFCKKFPTLVTLTPETKSHIIVL